MNSGTLALDKFLEQDIVEFLEMQAKLDKTDYKDKINDFQEALKRHDLSAATQILKKMVAEYNNLSSQDVYKDLTLNKIQELVKITTYYLDRTTWNNSLGKIIKQLEESDQLNQKNSKITVFSEHEKEKEDKEKLRLKKDYQLKDELDKKFDLEGQEIYMSIKKKDLKRAINSYKNMRVYFDQYPGRFEFEKKEHYNDLIAHYIQIKKLKDELKSKPKENISFDLARTPKNAHYLKINYINEVIDNIKLDVKRGEFDLARGKVLELKERLERVPETYSRLKTILTSKLNVLNQRIELARRISMIEEGGTNEGR